MIDFVKEILNKNICEYNINQVDHEIKSYELLGSGFLLKILYYPCLITYHTISEDSLPSNFDELLKPVLKEYLKIPEDKRREYTKND